MTLTLFMPGLPGQHLTVTLLRVERGCALVRTSLGTRQRYRLRDGLQVELTGRPAAWDLWRLVPGDCARVRAEVAPRP